MKINILRKYGISLILLILLTASFLVISSCGGGGGVSSSGDDSSIKYAGPFMYAQRPLDEEDWVDPTSEIQVLITDSTYGYHHNDISSCWLDTSSVNTSSFLVYDDMDNQVPGQVIVYNGEIFDPDTWKWYCGRDYAAVFTPNGPLKTDTKYNVKLTKDIKGVNGIHAYEELNFSFTAGPQGVGAWLGWPLKNEKGLPPHGLGLWTGSEIFVWSYESYGSRGGFYNPVSDSWREMSTENAPPDFLGGTIVWTGTEVLFWSGLTGARYTPATDSWLPVSTLNAPRTSQAVWTGKEMIVWGYYLDDFMNDWTAAGGRYNPATDIWLPVSTANAPQATNGQAVWTGKELIVWGAYADDYANDIRMVGGRYNPVTDSWVSLSTLNAPSPRIGHTAIWTGTEMIIWGGYRRYTAWNQPDHYDYYNSGGRYNPTTDSWTMTSMERVPPERADHIAIWTGSRMLVFGKHVYGGIYDPLTDTWTPMAPSHVPLDATSGVWTGERLYVWGNYAVDGGIYIPPLQ